MCCRQSRRRSVRPFRMAAAVPVLPTAEEVVALSMQLQPLRSADAVVALARAMARFPSGMPERAAAVADCMLKAGVAAAQCAMDQVTRLLERLRSSLQQWLEFVPSVDPCLAPMDTMWCSCAGCGCGPLSCPGLPRTQESWLQGVIRPAACLVRRVSPRHLRRAGEYSLPLHTLSTSPRRTCSRP